MKLVSKKEKPSYESLEKEVLKLKQMLLTAKNVIDEKRKECNQELSKEELTDRLASRVASIEMEQRKERIAVIIGGLYRKKKVVDRIDDFARSGLPLESIDKIVAPLRKKKK